MEDNFRNILIIISAIVITAIFIHGLWTIRKQKNPYKLKASKEKIDPISRDFDGKGFDQDGVGQVKVSKNSNVSNSKNDDGIEYNHLEQQATDHSVEEKTTQLSNSQVIQQKNIEAGLSELEDQLDGPLSEINNNVDVLPHNEESSHIEDFPLNDELDDWFNGEKSASFSKDELGDELTSVTEVNSLSKSTTETSVEIDKVDTVVKREPLYEQPVSRAKPVRETIKKHKRTSTKSKSAINQIEIDFDNQTNEKLITKENDSPQNNVDKQVKTDLEPQVIILSVVMPENQQMLGAVLLPSLLTLGLKYGEMNIFHRHEDNAGNGKVTFSLANMLNPGSFDLDSMENFATRGVSLFMTLPNAGDSMNVFEQMLNAAKQLAQEFNAQVIDENRNAMTKQTEQHYVGKIREFERKSRIALVE